MTGKSTKKLDFNILKNRSASPVSTKDSLKDITPFEWSKSVLSGTTKISVSEADK